MNDQSIVDKTMRSVFVGNIPYEVSEEKLKEIFGEVGPVLSFKLVFDRDSGKPKGYGFCEYKDQETALCAMRNLNNYEIAGRNLRVDNACTEKSRLEMQSLMQSAQVESTYGEAVSPDKAPEAVSKAVASLPPEQMYELIKQMKSCIQNNPSEARHMLLQNPQLTYALLQVMIVMKIIDPNAALGMLHPVNTVPTPLTVNTSTTSVSSISINNVSSSNSENHPVSLTDSKQQSFWNNANNSKSAIIPPPPMPPMVAGQDLDLRSQTTNRFSDQDLRNLAFPTAFPSADSFKRDPRESRDPRDPRLQQQMPESLPFQGMVPPGLLPPPNLPLPIPMPISGPGMPVLPNLPRMVPPPSGLPLPTRPPLSTNIVPSSTSVSSLVNNPTPLLSAVGNNSEKASLIMKVLRLSDEEIASLPVEQRQTILALKDQLAKSSGKR